MYISQLKKDGKPNICTHIQYVHIAEYKGNIHLRVGRNSDQERAIYDPFCLGD